MAKTLANYLADLDRAELESMRAEVQRSRARSEEEVKNLGFEEGLIEQALSKKARRSIPGAVSARAGQVSREQVYEILIHEWAPGSRFNTSEAAGVLKRAGLPIATNAARAHLRRLVEDERLIREGMWFLMPFKALNASSNGHGATVQAFPHDGGSRDGGE
jgi:hypothetical protein